MKLRLGNEKKKKFVAELICGLKENKEKWEKFLGRMKKFREKMRRKELWIFFKMGRMGKKIRRKPLLIFGTACAPRGAPPSAAARIISGLSGIFQAPRPFQ